MAKILCIEDSKEFQVYLSSVLRGHSLVHVGTISEALAVVESGHSRFDLILLDISLPDGNGMKILPRLKEALGEMFVPFIVISSDHDTLTKVAAFGVGADDFISKPPDSSELKARIEAKLRLAVTLSEKQTVLSFEDIFLDLERMSVEVTSIEVPNSLLDLTPHEFKILNLLMTRPGQVYSRDQIIERVWGVGKYITPRTVDAHVSHLRSKMKGSKARIETVPSVGYKLSKSV